MLLQNIIELLAPAACLGCGRQGEPLCGSCLHDASYWPECCYFCNRLMVGSRTCERCTEVAPLESVTVATIYEGPIKDLIWQLKFQRSRSAARVAAGLLADRLALAPQFDLITAVPIAPVRYRERGYNQAELVARALGRQLGLPYRSLLGRTRTDHQVGRDRHERLEAISGAFYPIRRLRNEHVLVVDDVLTTGATLAECARILSVAGAGRMSAAAVARKHSSQ
jgi:ComF family protein